MRETAPEVVVALDCLEAVADLAVVVWRADLVIERLLCSLLLLSGAGVRGRLVKERALLALFLEAPEESLLFMLAAISALLGPVGRAGVRALRAALTLFLETEDLRWLRALCLGDRPMLRAVVTPGSSTCAHLPVLPLRALLVIERLLCCCFCERLEPAVRVDLTLRLLGRAPRGLLIERAVEAATLVTPLVALFLAGDLGATRTDVCGCFQTVFRAGRLLLVVLPLREAGELSAAFFAAGRTAARLLRLRDELAVVTPLRAVAAGRMLRAVVAVVLLGLPEAPLRLAAEDELTEAVCDERLIDLSTERVDRVEAFEAASDLARELTVEERERVRAGFAACTACRSASRARRCASLLPKAPRCASTCS